MTITFVVIDVNDNPPVVSGNYDETFLEDTPINTIVFTLIATDADKGQNSYLTYSITKGDSNTDFFIDSGSGIIQLQKTLDRETIEIYHLEVTIIDAGVSPLNAVKTATLTVGDVNDNPPVFQPHPTTTYSFSVAENLPVSTIVGRVNATDADTSSNGAITYIKAYAIRGNSSHFSIDGSSGTIRTSAGLDREKEDSYVLVIRAVDGGSNTLTATVTVSITIDDYNDNEPYFSQPLYTGTVLENSVAGTSVLTVVIDDEDIAINDDITLTITDSPALVYIGANSTSFIIYVKAPIDRESIELLDFSLTATDGGIPPLSFTSQIQITIGDENDNKPVFSPTFYNSEIPYNDDCQLTVTTLTATDADAGINADVTYYTTLNNYPQFFSLDSKSGECTFVLSRVHVPVLCKDEVY